MRRSAHRRGGSNEAIRALRVVVVALAWALAASPWLAAAEEDEERRFRVGGLAFGDLYSVASHHTDAGDGAAGAVLRRGYLTFEADFSKSWCGRIRFEVNQAGKFETYTFEADAKDLFAGWKVGRHRQPAAGRRPERVRRRRNPRVPDRGGRGDASASAWASSDGLRARVILMLE